VSFLRCFANYFLVTGILAINKKPPALKSNAGGYGLLCATVMVLSQLGFGGCKQRLLVLCQKIPQHIMPVFRQNGLGMELYAFNIQVFMPDAHDFIDIA